jgi:outer membrane protein assembly factor BamB
MNVFSLRTALGLMFASLAVVILSAPHWQAASQAREGKQTAATAASQATFGGGIFRNMVNLVEKNVPTAWSVEPGKVKNVRWVVEVGNRSHSVPVIFDGRVYISTNNGQPRDKNVKGPKAVLMCFAAKDGSFLWQNLHDMPSEEVIREGLPEGLCCTPTIEGDFVYYCTPGSEVIRASTKDGKIDWRYDAIKELKVFPCYCCSCSPLIVGDMVFVVTGNGTNEQGKLVAPDAPSFVALDKKTGKLLWHSNLPGKNIIQGQWSNPVYAEVSGKPQIIFPGGDGWLYALEPKTGNLIWKFKCSPTPTKDDRGIRPYIVATPVVSDNRVYIAVGAYPGYEAAPRIGHFFCIDITKTGDVSCKNENFDPQDAANKSSALIWHFGGLVNPPPTSPKARKVRIGSSASTAAVHDGLVYIAEDQGFLHCLDADKGERYWEHDFKDAVLGSPYWVDGKIYVCASAGECFVFQHGKKFQPPVSNDIQEGGLESTPVVADGVLYILTPSKLYAIGAK